MTTLVLCLTVWMFAILISNQEATPFIVEVEDDSEEVYTAPPDNDIEFCDYVKCDPLIFESLRILPVLVTEDVEDEEKK